MDCERISRIQENLQTGRLEAVVCALPSNVLLLTGYWPVAAESIAVCVRGGPTVLLVPEDETELAKTGFADLIETFVPETLNETRSVLEAVRPRLADTLRKLKIKPGPIGVESGASSQAASYLAIHLFGDELSSMVHELLPDSEPTAIEEWIRILSSVKTPLELERIRQACVIAKSAFERGASRLQAGMTEPDAAQFFQALLSGNDVDGLPVQRCNGFAFCMSGPNSAKAYAAYARTRERTLESNDLVMIHCNSYVDGFWTDITRTYTLQPPEEQQAKMHLAVLTARKAALDAITPGARAAEVDAAARQVIHDFGLGQYLKHGTGHGVGFSPMSAYSNPRVHAGSREVIEEGMVFNVEPAVYIGGYGGVRHCDMVAVTKSGYELLTNFQSDINCLTISNESSTREEIERSTTPPCHAATAKQRAI